MKKLIFVFVALLGPQVSEACDACGCSLGGAYFGILPQFNRHFAGIRFTESSFKAHMHHPGSSLPPAYSNDTYLRLEAWGRVYVTRKNQLMAFVPYHINSMRGNEQNADVKGLGDVTVIGQYLLINTGEQLTSKFKHTLRAGLGIKLPTGKSNNLDDGTLLNPNFQSGTGSVDFPTSIIYNARYGKVGINTDAAYKINTRNSQAYLFGNQFNTSLSFFYWHNLTKAKASFLPNAGLYFEQAAHHHDRDVRKPNTGGQATFLSYGMELYVKSLALGINVKHPLQQRLNSEEGVELSSKNRLAIHLTYSF